MGWIAEELRFNPWKEARFFSSSKHPDQNWVSPSLYAIGIGGSFARGKVAEV
jgi:hypothetical protein